MKTAYTEVKTLSNEELRDLLIELREMQKMQAPRNWKQSELMTSIWQLEKDYYNFGTTYMIVKTAIEGEILRRVADGEYRGEVI